MTERGPSNQVVGSSTTAPRSGDGDRPSGRPRAQARGEGPKAPKLSLRARKKFFTGPQSESGEYICEIVAAADGKALVVRNGFFLEVTL
jgi:hypothetical protein